MELKDITKDAVVIRDDATLHECLSRMVAEQTNTLLVTGEEGTLVGEVGVSDLLDAIVPDFLGGDSIAAHFATEEMFEEAVHDAAEKPAHEFMATDIDPVRPGDNLMAVAASAIALRRARIPVVDEENRPIGIISRRGLKHILASYLGIEDSA